MISRAPSKGFSLIEILMVIIVIGVLSMLSISVFTDSIDESQFDNTVAEMNTIAKAIIGDKDLREGGTRTSFGYFGDVGAMPAALADLLTIPAGVTAYAVDNANRTAYGWNGPYLTGGDSGTDYTTDAWGNAYVYSPAAVPPTLVSLGADGAVGGTGFDQDITISFPANDRLATVEGFVSNAGAPFTALAEAEINYPDGTGGLAQTSDTNLDTENGHFSIANIPFGVRSVTIYEGDKATATAAETHGPYIITVDRPNFLVPANQLDVNP